MQNTKRYALNQSISLILKVRYMVGRLELKEKLCYYMCIHK
mgnify:FL=1